MAQGRRDRTDELLDLLLQREQHAPPARDFWQKILVGVLVAALVAVSGAALNLWRNAASRDALEMHLREFEGLRAQVNAHHKHHPPPTSRWKGGPMPVDGEAAE